MAHREGGVIVSKISRNEGKLVMKYFKIKKEKKPMKKKKLFGHKFFFFLSKNKKKDDPFF